MTKIEEIEAAIAKLAPEELETLGEWMDRRRETDFDRQIEADAKSGRLDSLSERLETENRDQAEIPLDASAFICIICGKSEAKLTARAHLKLCSQPGQ